MLLVFIRAQLAILHLTLHACLLCEIVSVIVADGEMIFLSLVPSIMLFSVFMNSLPT